MAVSSTATGIFVVAIGVIAAFLAFQGTITVGQLITVVGVVQVVMGPMEALAVNVGAVWARAGASSKRVLSLLQAPYAREARTGGQVTDSLGEHGQSQSQSQAQAQAQPGSLHQSPPLPPALVVAGLAGEHLRGLAFSGERGEIVGVVAEAHDAAELVSLLGGRIHPSRGSIKVNGLPLDEVDADRLHELVTAAPHAARTVPGTVAANVIGIGSGSRSPDDALTAAAFEDVLEQLPQGVRTPLGGAGRTLSGGQRPAASGQRQRLALARALAAPAPVLVLHEPTGSIDAVTEQHIGERMRSATATRATVVVCSNPQLLVRADRVLVLRGGALAAEGTHDELLATHPPYSEAIG